MRFASLGGLISAGLGILVVPAASRASDTKPPLPLLVPYGAHAGPRPLPPHHGRNAAVAPAGCARDTAPYFIGITLPYTPDFAGNASAVLSGYSNEACSTDDAIAGGGLNKIGGASDGGTAANSFIGSGNRNAITGANDFVGAGENNSVSGSQSFVGAGIENTGSGLYSFIGAGGINTVSGDGSFIGAGGPNTVSSVDSFIGAGGSNTVSGGGSFIGAGLGNTGSGDQSFVGAGYTDTGSGEESFVGAGEYNTASGASSAVGAGLYNNAQGNGSFIGAGDYLYDSTCPEAGCTAPGNTVTGVDSFIGDGDQNSVSQTDAFVGGGSHNTIAGSGAWGTVGGGHYNAVSGMYATIPGGASNTASGMLSLAAGYHADATHAGSFVWSDYVSGSPVVQDSAADQFVVRASGGTYVYSSENLKAGVKLAAGSGTWASLSDRDAKTDIAPLDDAAVLAKVATLPVSTWRYKTESGVRHVGPMAQDFYAAFGVGEDDRHITSIDEDGVAIAAIKALRENVVSLQARNATLQAGNARLRADNANLHADNADLHTENAKLSDRLTALEKKVEALAAK